MGFFGGYKLVDFKGTALSGTPVKINNIYYKAQSLFCKRFVAYNFIIDDCEFGETDMAIHKDTDNNLKCEVGAYVFTITPQSMVSVIKNTGIESITAGDGLNGGTITTTGTISLKKANTDQLGGIKTAHYASTDSTGHIQAGTILESAYEEADAKSFIGKGTLDIQLGKKLSIDQGIMGAGAILKVGSDGMITTGKQEDILQSKLIAGSNITLTPQQTGEVEIAATGGGGSSTWGQITGTLSDQTDLQTALDGKVNFINYSDRANAENNSAVWGVRNNNSARLFKCATVSTGSTIAVRANDGTITCSTPTNNLHAATKGYVDAAISAITSNVIYYRITISGTTATLADDKTYLDIKADLDAGRAVRLFTGTTTNLGDIYECTFTTSNNNKIRFMNYSISSSNIVVKQIYFNESSSSSITTVTK